MKEEEGKIDEAASLVQEVQARGQIWPEDLASKVFVMWLESMM